MQRNKIKADGTVYMVKQNVGSDTPARVVETARLWSYSVNGSYPNTVQLAPERRKMDTSTGPGHMWSRTYEYTGFLVIRAEPRNADALQALREFDMTHVRDMPTNAASLVSVWDDVLPEGLTLGVAVTRQFLDTWETVQEIQEQARLERVREREQFQRDQAQAAESETRVNDVMARYGIRQKYGSPPANRKYITLDADDLSNLLEKLDPQRVLDAVADHLMDTYDFSPVPERILQEIQGSAEIVRRKIRGEIA